MILKSILKITTAIRTNNRRLCQWFAYKWYQFKCWAWKRYTTIKPRYLPHTWIDKDELIIHVVFEVLSEFFEGEKPFETINWKATGTQHIIDELYDHYQWWHTYHDHDPMDGFHSGFMDIHKAINDESAWEAELTRRAQRVLELRGYLWT